MQQIFCLQLRWSRFKEALPASQEGCEHRAPPLSLRAALTQCSRFLHLSCWHDLSISTSPAQQQEILARRVRPSFSNRRRLKETVRHQDTFWSVSSQHTRYLIIHYLSAASIVSQHPRQNKRNKGVCLCVCVSSSHLFHQHTLTQTKTP